MANDDFAAQVLADGPVGYWRLGETLGSVTAADASGNGNDGTCSGGVRFGQSTLFGGDTAALFDGSTGRISVPNSATLNPARITMEAIVSWDGQTGFQQRILEKESYAGITQYGLSVLPDGRVHVELRRRVSGPPQVVAADSVGLVARAAETHIVATYDGLAIQIYVNGSLDSTTPVNASPVDIDTKWPHSPPDDPEVTLAIGDRMSIIPPDTHHRTFNGLIDEVALYPEALPVVRIRGHFESLFRLQLVASTSVGGVWHTIRHADGSWVPSFGDVKGQEANDPGYFAAVGCAGVGDELHVVGLTDVGGMWHTIRHADGSWQPSFGDVKAQEANDPGHFSVVACAAG